MTPTRRRSRSATDQHRGWLELVDTDGPFLSVPALKRIWPQGMPQPDDDALARLREAKPPFEKAWEWLDSKPDDERALPEYRSARDEWVGVVLRDVVGWGDSYVTDAGLLGGLAAAKGAFSLNGAISVRPTGLATHAGSVGALVLVTDPVDSLRDPVDDGWAASPIDRMEEMLRAAEVPIGVVTDGRWWAIVSARKNTMVASGIVDAQTWIEEPATRNAFLELLRRQRLLGGDPAEQLTAMFGESVAAAEEITEALGVQVRRAVELLVQSFSEAAIDARQHGEPDPLPANRHEVYEAAVTVMMRVVFLLFAEERGLLPQSQLFTVGYGMSGRLDGLDERMREEGAEALDATNLTWHRLLASSGALYFGASFEDLRLPSYGGSLFDPARFPFLLRRRENGALAVAVTDRVMLEVLRAVQMAELRGEPARRISFRDIDVEQIGYIYEGLLGYSCREANEVTVGLVGKAGEEPEIALAALEALSAEAKLPDKIAEKILAYVAEAQPAAKPPSKTALAKATRGAADVEDAERALRAVTSDAAVRERLRPFIALIRRDLRNRPFVVQPGGLLTVETPSRATAGAHYTPKSLAEQVVRYALEPLAFSPGPHELADRAKWIPVSSDRILELKVADIACGSGAFLVAAARYLADRLIEAWHREGVAFGTPHELRTRAIRKVVASCLYGADVNAMAVEMCKLSLWLVSLDPKLPFSFVDDKVLHGNSLLGLTLQSQLEMLNINPPTVSAESLFDLDPAARPVARLDVSGVLAKAVSLRRSLATEVSDDDPQRSATTKRRQWRDYQALVAQLSHIADGVIGAGLTLGGKPSRGLNEAYEHLRIAVGLAYPDGGRAPDPAMLDGMIATGLTPTAGTDYERWQPLHWILAVPDVMEHGGFDAVIGNPPFLGAKKLSSAVGSNVREWLVNAIADGVKGNADLVAYFLLRARSLLGPSGSVGLIATNTVAQGDTREVGLDQLVKHDFTITRSIQSRSWPAASANLEYAAVWGSLAAVAPTVPRISDDAPVARISTLLEPAGRVIGTPVRLQENLRIAFQGCVVLGMGFVIEPETAAEWIEADPHNAEVLSPYLNGDDLNSRPDASSSRWVIDFGERSANEAREYLTPWRHVEQLVRPERTKKDVTKYPRMVKEWWKFWNARPGLRRATAGLEDVMAVVLHSKSVMPLRVQNDCIFSHALGVFADDSYADQAVLSSSLHQMWAITYGSTLETRVRYTPSDVFETFPRPRPIDELHEIGKILDVERREIMLRRQLGLTKLYNLINDPEIADAADVDVARLRQIHVELDHAVMEAYGWGDVPLDHGFYTYRQMQRWTVSPAARVEILDRVLEENHRRAAAQGDAPAIEPDEAEEEDE